MEVQLNNNTFLRNLQPSVEKAKVIQYPTGAYQPPQPTKIYNNSIECVHYSNATTPQTDPPTVCQCLRDTTNQLRPELTPTMHCRWEPIMYRKWAV